MTPFDQILDKLRQNPRRWLITGAAGFIGSNLLEALLTLGQTVTGLDNFLSGHRKNIEQVKACLPHALWRNFTLVEGDIRDLDVCGRLCTDVDIVLHHAALGSVPHSLADPVLANAINVDGFVNMLTACRDAGVHRFVYAVSSAAYGDSPTLPKREGDIGRPLSPYAVSKYVNELYADVFSRAYGLQTIGLRYFNIFGPRQDPDGAYAAVIPKWFSAFLHHDPLFINGDGQTSRDFCYIDNCIQANLLAACTENKDAVNQVYNIAFGQKTTLNDLFEMIRNQVVRCRPGIGNATVQYRDFRPGDVRHSLADISKAHRLLGYAPRYSVSQGLEKAAQWYVRNLG